MQVSLFFKLGIIVNELKIRKSQDLAKDLGGTASKAEKEICQSKIVSSIQKHNKTVVPKMKTKALFLARCSLTCI